MQSKNIKASSPQLNPWCWYCEREFEDKKILTEHQIERHYSCNICITSFEKLTMLQTHYTELHDQILKKVPFALPGRDDFKVIVDVMENIPEKDQLIHKKKIEDQEKENSYRISLVNEENSSNTNFSVTEDTQSTKKVEANVPEIVKTQKNSKIKNPAIKDDSANSQIVTENYDEATPKPTKNIQENVNLVAVTHNEDPFFYKTDLGNKLYKDKSNVSSRRKHRKLSKEKESFRRPDTFLNGDSKLSWEIQVEENPETITFEERRAMSSKYRYSLEEDVYKVKLLNSSIDERIANIRSGKRKKDSY